MFTEKTNIYNFRHLVFKKSKYLPETIVLRPPLQRVCLNKETCAIAPYYCCRMIMNGKFPTKYDIIKII